MASVPKLLLVDINVLGFASMHQARLVNRHVNGEPTGVIHGTFERLIWLMTEYPQHIPVILWDERCHWREAILPSYKRHRWTTPEQQALLHNYLRQASVVRQLLTHLGVLQTSCPGFEADDLAGIICRNVIPEWQVVLATSDTDWYQALRPNVIWHSTSTGARVTVDELGNPDLVRDGPFHSTDHYVWAKALAGDASDGIPGVRGVGIKTAARIIGEYGSVEKFWVKCDSGIPINRAILARVARPDSREMYARNLRLIDWRLAPPLPAEFEFQPVRRDKRAYLDLCNAWRVSPALDRFELPPDRAESAANVAAVIGQTLAVRGR
jgi:DNA polymerase I